MTSFQNFMVWVGGPHFAIFGAQGGQHHKNAPSCVFGFPPQNKGSTFETSCTTSSHIPRCGYVELGVKLCVVCVWLALPGDCFGAEKEVGVIAPFEQHGHEASLI